MPIQSKSPLATGEHKPHTMGRTQSGKTIHSDPHHPSHSAFTRHDHVDAYHAHNKRVQDLSYVHNYPGRESLIRHHEKAREYHRDKSFKS